MAVNGQDKLAARDWGAYARSRREHGGVKIETYQLLSDAGMQEAFGRQH